MIVKLIIAIVLMAIAWRLISNYRKQASLNNSQVKILYAVYGLLFITVLLAVTGHLHWLGAAFTALAAAVIRFLPLAARFAPMLFQYHQQKNQSGQSSGGNQSTVNSKYLTIVLDHDSETMTGNVIDGPHSGVQLDRLEKNHLRELLLFYDQNDHDSFQLLLAYVHRQFPNDDWDVGSSQQSQSKTGGSSAMTQREALEILGLNDGASKSEIKKAHKQLMQRVHPDRGGSPYLAAKINAAKDFLLKWSRKIKP